MTNFLVILVALVGGYALRRSGKAGPQAAGGINAWIMNLAMPAVVMKYVPQISWSPQALFPLLAPVLVVLGAWAFVRLLGPVFRWSRGERTALLLSSGLANTSFVGFPLILAYAGPGSLAPGVLCDQMSFLLLATVGIGAAAASRAAETRDPGGASVGRTVLQKVFTFPPLLAFPVALVLPLWVDLAPLAGLFDALGATLAPMALFSVGLQLSFTQVRQGGVSLAAGLLYKLILAPALVLGAAILLGVTGDFARIAVFEAAMAPMITSAVVAAEYATAPRLATAMVGIGIPLSLVTTALWWQILHYLF